MLYYVVRHEIVIYVIISFHALGLSTASANSFLNTTSFSKIPSFSKYFLLLKPDLAIVLIATCLIC